VIAAIFPFKCNNKGGEKMDKETSLKKTKPSIIWRIVSLAIILFTLTSLAQILYIRAYDIQGSLLWTYAVLMTIFLLFMFAYETRYTPIQDSGYRPSVSVIIPAKNEENAIKDTVNAVLDSDYPPEKLEVIMIDDGSTDGTTNRMQEIISDRVTFIKHEVNKGKREAFASGFRVAKGEIIISIDSDSYVEKDAIKLLVQPFTDRKISAVAGHGNVYNKDKNFLTKLQHYWYQEMFRLTKGMESKLNCVTCCSGILAAYRKDVLTTIIDEWLDEKFLGRKVVIGDDRQLTNYVMRGDLKQIGLKTKEIKVKYQANAIVWTVAPDNYRQFIKQQLRWNRSLICETYLAFKFMWKKPFPVPLYFYIHNILKFLSLIVILLWLVWKPLNNEWDGILTFVIGTYYIGFLHAINVWKYDTYSTEPIFYRTLFVTISLLISIFIMPYAFLTVRKDGWITRSK
jgi:hyaluronan synthase